MNWSYEEIILQVLCVEPVMDQIPLSYKYRKYIKFLFQPFGEIFKRSNLYNFLKLNKSHKHYNYIVG